MEPTKEIVLKELIGMCYDLVIAESQKSSDPQEFSKRFLYEIATVELEFLKEDYGFIIPRYSHPLAAIKQYIILMVKSNSYISLDTLRFGKIDSKEVELIQWRCGYHPHCKRHTNPICVRGIAQGYAVDTMSDGKFKDLEVVYDHEHGNCRIILRIDYTEDLRTGSAEAEKVGADIYRVLTKDENLNLSINVWIAGIERAAIKFYGKSDAIKFLQKFYIQLVNKWIEKFFKIDYYIGIPISNWLEGKLLFKHPGV